MAEKKQGKGKIKVPIEKICVLACSRESSRGQAFFYVTGKFGEIRRADKNLIWMIEIHKTEWYTGGRDREFHFTDAGILQRRRRCG